MIKLAMNMMMKKVPCLFSRRPTARKRVVENSMPRGCAQKTVETFSCSLLQMSTTRVPATIRVETLSGKPALPWVSFQGSGHRPSSLLRHPVRSIRRGKFLSAVVEVIRPEAVVLGLTQMMTSSSWKFACIPRCAPIERSYFGCELRVAFHVSSTRTAFAICRRNSLVHVLRKDMTRRQENLARDSTVTAAERVTALAAEQGGHFTCVNRAPYLHVRFSVLATGYCRGRLRSLDQLLENNRDDGRKKVSLLTLRAVSNWNIFLRIVRVHRRLWRTMNHTLASRAQQACREHASVRRCGTRYELGRDRFRKDSPLRAQNFHVLANVRIRSLGIRLDS